MRVHFRLVDAAEGEHGNVILREIASHLEISKAELLDQIQYQKGHAWWHPLPLRNSAWFRV